MLESFSSALPGGFTSPHLHRGLKPTATIARPYGRRNAPIKHDPYQSESGNGGGEKAAAGDGG